MQKDDRDPLTICNEDGSDEEELFVYGGMDMAGLLNISLTGIDK